MHCRRPCVGGRPAPRSNRAREPCPAKCAVLACGVLAMVSSGHFGSGAPTHSGNGARDKALANRRCPTGASASASSGRHVPTHCCRRRFFRRTTGLPWNLTFAEATEKSATSTAVVRGWQPSTGTGSRLNDYIRCPRTGAADPNQEYTLRDSTPQSRPSRREVQADASPEHGRRNHEVIGKGDRPVVACPARPRRRPMARSRVGPTRLS
jgi:hypothetical protein